MRILSILTIVLAGQTPVFASIYTHILGRIDEVSAIAEKQHQAPADEYHGFTPDEAHRLLGEIEDYRHFVRRYGRHAGALTGIATGLGFYGVERRERLLELDARLETLEAQLRSIHERRWCNGSLR